MSGKVHSSAVNGLRMAEWERVIRHQVDATNEEYVLKAEAEAKLAGMTEFIERDEANFKAEIYGLRVLLKEAEAQLDGGKHMDRSVG